MRSLRSKAVPSTNSYAQTLRQKLSGSRPVKYPTQLQCSSELEHQPLVSNRNETPSSFTGEDATRKTHTSGPLLPPSTPSPALPPALGPRGYPVVRNSVQPDTKQASRRRQGGLTAWNGASHQAGEAPPPLSPKLPTRVNPSEVGMLNPVWIDIQGHPEDFVAHKDVPFLWAQREDGNVILGVEEPWKYPEAFAESAKPMLDEMKKHYEAQAEQGRAKGITDRSGGHPTEAAQFEPNGEVSTQPGAAFLGGELRYNKDDKRWVLDNCSGRFGRNEELVKRSVKKESVQQKLDEVATRIQEQTGLSVDARVMSKKMMLNNVMDWLRRK